MSFAAIMKVLECVCCYQLVVLCDSLSSRVHRLIIEAIINLILFQSGLMCPCKRNVCNLPAACIHGALREDIAAQNLTKFNHISNPSFLCCRAAALQPSVLVL